MRTVLHIFLKDVRQMRWTLALWGVLLAVQLAASLSAKQTTIADWDFILSGAPKLPIWTLLHWIGLVGITFGVMLADRAFGTEPVWKTRPIARWHMAAAKLGFVTVFTVLLPGVLEFFALTGQGVPIVNALRALALVVPTQAFVVSWMVMLACMCRGKRLEVIILAPLSIGAPFLILAGSGAVTRRLNSLPSFAELGQLLDSEPIPDLDWPISMMQWLFRGWASLPLLFSVALVWVAFVQSSRRRAIGCLALVAILMMVSPPFGWLLVLKARQPFPVSSTQSVQPKEIDLSLEWQTQRGYPSPHWALETKWRLPASLTVPEGNSVARPSHGWVEMTVLRNALKPAGQWQNRVVSATQVEMEEAENYWLAHNRLQRHLGPHSVLNPPAASGHTNHVAFWQGHAPSLHSASKVKFAIYINSEEAGCQVVERMPFRDYLATKPKFPQRVHGHSENEVADYLDDRVVVVSARRADLSIFSERGQADAPATKAVLWHPGRKEVLLATTRRVSGSGNLGVTAFPVLWRVEEHRYHNRFPHSRKGEASSADSPGPEWFAEAELLLLAFKPVATRHHVILVPDVPLPPVPSLPPKP